MDFESSGPPNAFVKVTLQFPDAFRLSIEALDGFGLFFGEVLTIQYDHGSYPQELTIDAGPSGIVGGLYLPAALFSDARPGAPTDAPAQIVVENGFGITTSGGVLIEQLTLPPTSILGSDITISASGVVLDFDPDNDLPESADGSFQGVKLGEVDVFLPESLGGIHLEGHDFLIDSDGLDGYVCWEGGTSFDVAGATIGWSSLCVRFEDNEVSFENVVATIGLPASYFGCTTGVVEAQVTVTEAGVITGALDVENGLPYGCQSLAFGNAGQLELAAVDVSKVDCSGQSSETKPTASFIRVMVDLDNDSFMLAGYPDAAGEAGSEVSLGLLVPNEDNLKPKVFDGGVSQPGILLPATMTFSSNGACIGCLDDNSTSGGNGLYMPPMTVADTDAWICVENLVLDLDDTRVAWAEGMEPKGLENAGSEWRGLYAQAIQATLPPSANRNGTEEITISAERLGVSDDGVWMTLGLSQPLWLALGELNGFGVVLGDPVGPAQGSTINLQWDRSLETFKLYAEGADPVVGAITLPNGPLHPAGQPMLDDDQNATLDDYARLEIRAGVDSPILADGDGNCLLEGLALTETEVSESGVTLAANGLAFDFHTNESPSVNCDDLDPDVLCPTLPPEFKGVYVEALTLATPEDWGGVTVSARNFYVDGDGVNGKVRGSFDNVEVDVGAAAVSLDSVCVELIGDSVTGQYVGLCGIGGTMALPLDYFGCRQAADGATLPVALNFDASTDDDVFTGKVDLSSDELPDACRTLTFGGNALEIGGNAVPTWSCAEDGAGADETTASWLAFELTGNAHKDYTLAVGGWDSDPDVPGAALKHIGALKPDPSLLVPRGEADAIVLPSEVTIGKDGVCIGCAAGDASGFSLPPMGVGGTGIVICGDDIAVDADTGKNAWGDPPPDPIPSDEGTDWMGLYAEALRVELPFEESGGSGGFVHFDASHLAVGTRGVTGTFASALPDIRFGGDFIVSGINAEMTLVHNTPTAITVEGTLEDVAFLGRSLPVSFALKGNGDWLVELGTGPEPLSITEGASGYELKMMLERLAFGNDGDDYFISMDAGLELVTPVFGTGQVKLQGFKITDDGDVLVDGGWYTFDQPRVMSLGGFSYELNRLSFGRTDDARNAVTLGGALQLQDVLPVQAKVHDLVVSWGDGFTAPKYDVSAIDLSMEIPGVLKLDGGLRWCESGLDGCGNDGPGGDLGGSKWFQGDVAVALNSPPMSVGGKLLVGKHSTEDEDWSFWYTKLDAQLPAGIPIPSTGVSLYGFSGGFGKNVKLNISREFPRLLNTANPVTPERKSFVFQAGTTLGSTHDNGFTFNSDVDFLIQIPGPVVVFDGQAWIATKRNERDLPPLLHLSATFDAIEKYFAFGLTARYKINRDNGDILDLGGNAELLLGEDAWHVFIGTKESPITAKLLGFGNPNILGVGANAFMMAGTDVPFETGNRSGFMTGGNIKADFKAGADSVIGVEAGLSLGGEMSLQMQPKQAAVELDLGGYLRAFLWKFKLGFSLDAMVKGQVAKPFKLGAKLRLKFNLPWPLPDPKFTVNIDWEKDNQGQHRFPSPLKEVVFESETTGETVTAYDVSLNEYDEYPDAGAVERQVCTTSELEIPFDSVAKITFARPVDCRNADGLSQDVRRCDGSAGNPLPNPDHYDDDYFTDTVGDCQVRYRFTEWLAAGSGTPIDLTGGWGGALGDAEVVGATEARRWETFSFRPVKLTDGALCPSPSGTTNAAVADACKPITTVPARCRVLEGASTCWEAGAPAEAAFDGRYRMGGRVYTASDDLLSDAGRCDIPEALGIGECGGAATSEPYAACCLPDGQCIDTTRNRCDKVNGSFDKRALCDPDDDLQCLDPDEVGACCRGGGECREMYRDDCLDVEGTFNAGATCDGDTCADTGACCMREGECALMTFDACFDENAGVFWNANQACYEGCLDQQSIGACCLPNGTCERVSGGDCNEQGGFFTVGAECSGACPPRGACCTADGCFEGTSLECVTLGGDGEWSAGTSCADACLGSCCSQGACHVTTENDCDGGWRSGGDCGVDACAFGACCTSTGCVQLSDTQCLDLAGTFNHGASCEDAGVCQEMVDGSPCCCERPLAPVVCEEADGPALFSGYLVSSNGSLYAIDHPSDGIVGRCDPIPGQAQSSSCPTDAPAACDAFAPSAPVMCYLTDGTALVPAADELQTKVDASCDPPPPGPPAPYCPSQSYRVSLRARSDAMGGDACQVAPEEICDLSFRVAPAPADLTPYVRWTMPEPSARPVYLDNDVSVQFTTDVLCELYSCCADLSALDVRLHAAGQDGGPALAGTLMSAGCAADMEPALPRFGQSGDLLVFDPTEPLRPAQRYVVTIPGAPGGAPLYQTSFVTSRFPTFSAALANAHAYTDDNTTMFLETAEALDWRHVTAHLDSADAGSLDPRRISADDATVHVWEFAEGTAPGPNDVLYLVYHSASSGQCACALDADCDGGGRCVDGRCEGGYECLDSAECGPEFGCLRDGPAVLSRGDEVLEEVPLTLQQTGGE